MKRNRVFIVHLLIGVSGQINAIHEVDHVCIAGVVTVDISGITIIPDAVQFAVATVVCLRRILCSVRSAFCETYKINIVFSFGEKAILRINAFVQVKSLTVICFVPGSRKRFHIIINRFGAIAGFIQMESNTLRRHNVYIDQHLVESRTALRAPTFAIIICYPICSNDGEIVFDRLLIERGDGLDRLPVPGLVVRSSIYSTAVYCTVIVV